MTHDIDFLVKNKRSLIAQKRATLKYADGVACVNIAPNAPDVAYKANGVINTDGVDVISVKAVINTTNIIDSHMDLHAPGLWTKTLKENRLIMHLQEHKMTFDSIISDGEDLKAYVKDFTWSELGESYNGTTQALMFDSQIKRERNPYMFEQYAKGRVRNHSVGMQYMKIFLAVGEKKYEEDYAIWEKYYPIIANKEVADEMGYFWVVTEAKAIEGSAVPLGSNRATPTYTTESGKASTLDIEEPHNDALLEAIKQLSTKI
jgi:hypothetical protein